jgi:GNAT superfamily N-acetyltransferase
MNWNKDIFLISTDKTLLQFPRLYKFLSTEAYWCLGIPEETVRNAIENSLCFGVYDTSKNSQIGFARIITDSATFAYLCDVYVEDSYRGNGLSKWLMECIQEHPSLQNLRRFMLATKDAHGLYGQFGFKVTKAPERLMEIVNPDIYKQR